MGSILIALLAWGALAFGAVYPWAYWPLAAGCAALGIWTVLKTESWRDPRTTTLGVALGAVAAGMALQLVPLPARAVSLFSPALTSYFERYQFGYQPPPYQPLSIEPALTWTALGLFVALGLLLVGLARALRRVGLDWLLNALMALGVTLAIIGILQKVTMTDPAHPLVYGFWKPREGGQVFGPFINRNHFAGWMVMALPIVIGYSCGIVAALRRPQRGGWKDWLHWGSSVEANRFILAVGAILVMAASLMLTQSRSGLLGFAAGVAVVAVFVVARATQPAVRAAALLYFGALLVGAVMWTGNSAVIRWEAAPKDVTGRTDAWRDTLAIMRDFPMAGTGLGTYGKAMLVYQSGGREMMYAQAHNDYLQLAAEGGLLVGLPAVVVLVLLVRNIRRRLNAPDDDIVTSWVRVGAIAGLVGIGLQSMMEFSLQMPGNAVMFVFVAALAMHRPRRSSRAHRI